MPLRMDLYFLYRTSVLYTSHLQTNDTALSRRRPKTKSRNHFPGCGFLPSGITTKMTLNPSRRLPNNSFCPASLLRLYAYLQADRMEDIQNAFKLRIARARQHPVKTLPVYIS